MKKSKKKILQFIHVPENFVSGQNSKNFFFFFFGKSLSENI